MTTKKNYEFITTSFEGQIKSQFKECKFPLNTSLFTKLFIMKCKNEILQLEIKDKENTIYKTSTNPGRYIG